MKKAVRIYLDCNSCDQDYIRTELKFVNFVRDRNEAGVHILITTQNTGSGGDEYTITFIGLNEYSGINDTLVYHSQKTDTDEIIRKGIVKTLKLGLIRYVARTPLASKLSVAFDDDGNSKEEVKDSWDYWVFSLSGDGFFNGEQLQTYSYYSGSLSANRTTPDLKINISARASENINKFQLDDTTNYESFNASKSFNGLAVFSLDDHWSYGFSTGISSSTYSNNNFSLTVAPGLEYDLFAYSEATRKQLRFLYRIGNKYADYKEETIYGKTNENLIYHDLSISFEIKETWGSINATLTRANYFHDFSKNHTELYGGFSINLFEGFSLNLNGSYQSVHDQLALPASGASTEEKLTQQRQLETQYYYYYSIGFSYTFGSIFNNVVNPRFGN